MSFVPTSTATATSTSDESHLLKNDIRSLTEAEQRLIAGLLCMTPEGASLKYQLAGARVQTMLDGGMGSVRFVGSSSRRAGRVLVSTAAHDADAVPLLISLDLDQHGHLFELDVWKVDFSSLKRLPEPSDVTLA